MKIYNKKLSKFLSCIMMMVLLSGCEKFLDQSDPSNFTVDNYYTTAAHAESATIAAYSRLRDIWVATGGFGGWSSPWIMYEMQTGLCDQELGEAYSNLKVRTLTNDSDNVNGNSMWTLTWRGIANCNVAIEKIPTIKMDAAKQTKLLGECRFLRAWYYYWLTRTWGRIPLITKPVDLASSDMYPKQSEIADIYKVIVEDLLFAESAGLPDTDATGRVSKLAVKSYLADVYLTMAGYPLQAGSEYYQKAADKANEVIQSGKFDLFPTYYEMHDPKIKNTGEWIFQAQMNQAIGESYWQRAITPYYKEISAYDAETGAIYGYKPWIDSWEAGDKRREEKQFFYTNFTSALDRNVVVELGKYYIYKLFDVDAHLKYGISSMNWGLMRYAEILLIFAEASNEAAGPTTASYEAVNKIRRKANLPELSGLTKEQFREKIWNEKFVELCYENKMWFDMVRIRKGYDVPTKKFVNLIGYKFDYGNYIYKERELVFPFPTNDMDTNENLVQNPGY